MKKLTERDIDEIESVKHYIRYVNTNPNVFSYEIYDAISRLDEIGKKYVLADYDQKEIDTLIELEDVKDLLSNFISKLKINLKIEEE